MRRYSCAWCTAETTDRFPPVACMVCGEQGSFLFRDMSPPSLLRTVCARLLDHWPVGQRGH
jgi:hypothetical protein